MAKKDFLSELVNDMDAKKRGEKNDISHIEDYAKHRSYQEETTNEVELPSFIESEVPVAEVPQVKKPVFVQPEVGNLDEDAEPSSFDEERRVKIEKPKKQLSKGLIATLIGLLILIAFLIWFFLLRATILVPDFVGRPISEVSTWAKQNKMESSAIAMGTSVFSLEYDKDIVIEQSVSAGKKVKKDTPITIIVSKGPDPDEKLSFPDFKSMSQVEVEDWIKKNKLLKTKLTTQFSDTVPAGSIISYDLKGKDEANFTRGATLTIVASKGVAPAGQITVENFSGKTYSEMEVWARNKKVELKKTESFSDTVEAGKIISADRKQGDTMKEGETITAIVSKGKGVTVPNLVGYDKSQLEVWEKKNSSVSIVGRERYSEQPLGTVIEQKTAPGTVVGTGDVVEITTSLYMPILETKSDEWIGRDYLELKAKVDEFNSKGASIQAGQYNEYQYNECSDDPAMKAGAILAYACYYGTSDLANGCGRPLNLHSRIAYKISTGPCTVKHPQADGEDGGKSDQGMNVPSEPNKEKYYILKQANLQNKDTITAFCNQGVYCTFEETADGEAIQVYKDNQKIAYTGYSGEIIVTTSDQLQIKVKK